MVRLIANPMRMVRGFLGLQITAQIVAANQYLQ